MVNNLLQNNAVVLEEELDWFHKVLDTRIKLHFGHECEYKDVFEITPPEIDPEQSMYGNFIQHYRLSIAERIVFLLGLVPHVRPQLLDVFFTKNSAYSREFTEFGRRNGYSYSGFLPTGETALFLLAGDDIEKRLTFTYLFAFLQDIYDLNWLFAIFHIGTVVSCFLTIKRKQTSLILMILMSVLYALWIYAIKIYLYFPFYQCVFFICNSTHQALVVAITGIITSLLLSIEEIKQFINRKT